ncbi:MAG: quinolinate synthase NadA [Clostridia bacterium]
MKDEIIKLKKEKNAVILAHYYVQDEVQEIADFVGDSYYLAKVAKESDADIIVFCGVKFMGESAKIVNPDKMVLLPEKNADCPMAHMATVESVKKIKSEYDDIAVVCYINSSVELKSVSDVCVTSSNAIKIVKSLPNKNILFIPDENLGRYCQSKIPEKNFVFNKGYCHVHSTIDALELMAVKEKYPSALVLAHPECRMEILDIADFIGSTSAIIEFSQTADCDEFIIATEVGILYELKSKSPNKKFHIISEKQCCPDMKSITLESVLSALKNNNHQVFVDDVIAINALKPLEKMLDLAK